MIEGTLDEQILPGLERAAVRVAAGDFKNAVRALERAERPPGVDTITWWAQLRDLASGLADGSDDKVQLRAMGQVDRAEAEIARLENERARTVERREASAAFMDRAKRGQRNSRSP
jgi:hypothetical protein